MKKRKRKSRNAILTSVRAELARPRMSKSARMTELNSDTTKISEQPRTIIPGIVDKLIPSPTPCLGERAQISINGETGYRKLRIENSLTDEYGDEVKLEKGGRVEVTVTAEGRQKANRKVLSSNVERPGREAVLSSLVGSN
jgi:hypothetical protein